MDALSLLAGGAVSLATVLITHWLKRDERRDAARKEFESEKLAAWARLHDRLSRYAATQSVTISELQDAYECTATEFASVMQYLDNETRGEIAEAVVGFGEAIHEVAECEGTVPDTVFDTAISRFMKLRRLINTRHWEEAERSFQKHSR